MLYKHDIRWRQMHRPTHASRMPAGWYLLIVENCSTIMEVGSMLHMCCIWVEQVDPHCPEMYCLLCLTWPSWMVLNWWAHCLQVALGLRFSFAQPLPLVCHPWPALSWDQWVASSVYVGSVCATPHPWGIPHRLVHWDRPFHHILPVFPSVLYFMVTLQGSDTD